MRCDQPTPWSPWLRLGCDLLVIVAGLLFCWFGLGGLAVAGCAVLAFYVSDTTGFTVLDMLALVVVGRAVGDLTCGIVLGRFLRKISPWYLLPCLAVLHALMLFFAIAYGSGEMPRLPLPLVPAVLVSVFATGAGIKLGRHWRGLADMRREDPEAKRPWFQFRLRTLMLFVLLCSVLLGSWCALLEPFRRRARLIATIEQRWGSVFIEDEGPAWLSRLLGKRYTGSVVSIAVSKSQSPVQLSEEEILEILESTDKLRELSLSETPITDAGLAGLRRLPGLEDLSLMDTTISGDGLRHLKALPALLHLDLGYSEITEESLVHLEALINLQSLSLIKVQVADEGLVHLESLRKLSWLALSETKITDKGLVHLRGLGELKLLLLSDTAIRGQGLAHISGLKRLRYVDLAGTSIADDALVHLKDLSALETLCLGRTNIDGEGLVHLAKLQNLKALWLDDTDLNDCGLAHVGLHAALERLSLDNTQVTDAGLVPLKGLPNLKHLSLSNTQITDAGLAHIRTLDRLESLYLDGTRTTEQRLLELNDAMPDCWIAW